MHRCQKELKHPQQNTSTTSIDYALSRGFYEHVVHSYKSNLDNMYHRLSVLTTGTLQAFRRAYADIMIV